jgi:hypothetical protein
MCSDSVLGTFLEPSGLSWLQSVSRTASSRTAAHRCQAKCGKELDDTGVRQEGSTCAASGKSCCTHWPSCLESPSESAGYRALAFLLSYLPPWKQGVPCASRRARGQKRLGRSAEQLVPSSHGPAGVQVVPRNGCYSRRRQSPPVEHPNIGTDARVDASSRARNGCGPASELQAAELIGYARGALTAGTVPLGAGACECYEILGRDQDRSLQRLRR